MVEIETQVPLIDESNEILPQSPTMEIEHALDLKEARFRGTKTNWVYTEDYLLTVKKDDVESKLARSIKYLDDLVFYADDGSMRILVNLNTHSVSFEHPGPLTHCQV